MQVTSGWALVAAVIAGASGCASTDTAVPDGGAAPGRDGSEEQAIVAVDVLIPDGEAPEGGVRSPVPGDGGTQPSVVDAGGPAACHAVAAAHPDEGALHELQCSPTSYQTNPPSSGNHYSIWASYKTYASTFPSGFWVHNLEHGAIVITYHCDDGCPTEVAAAQALIDSLPVDPACDVAVKRRIIMLPDPDLSTRFAASSWGFTLRADCFDAAAFANFITEHYNHGREDLCGDGIDPLTANGGAPVCPP